MSLVAWYPLIDGSLENKGLDTTPLTLHGTIPFTDGRVRTAPTFSANKSNYYTMPPITKTNNFSVCCWMKCSSVTSSWIFWQGVIGSINLGFNITSLGKLQYVCSPKIIVTDLPLNTWIHICMTIDDNGYMNCYLNSENVGSASTNGFNYTEGDDLYIGLAKIVYPFNGQLQDFRYYDHCLSPKEVKEIAKGLCLHLPLKGTNARPNLFKNSATMFNSLGNNNDSFSTWKKTLEFDENSPCGVNGKKLKVAFKREEGETAMNSGVYHTPAATAMPNLTIGATYCTTVWARCTVPNVMLRTNVVQSQRIISNSNRTLTSEWKRYYFIFSALSETYTTCFYMENVPVGVEGVFEVCCPKLELLSPTPYIPNVDDTQYSDYVLDYEPDCSGNEFDATKYGDLTTSDSNGRYNTAVAFNGTNTYLQGLAPTNSECKEFTIATWVKLNNNTSNQAIYACRTVIGQGLVLFYLGATGGIRLDDGVANNIFPNSTLEPNKWYHIAVTRDTAERKLYINGNFVSSGATTGALVNMGTMYQIGESNAQTTTPIGNFLNGTISDFRLYTSALSADDVKELYETSVSIAHNPPSLTESAYYNYVEGQKHSTFDKSKFTVVGSPTITDDGINNAPNNNANYIMALQVPFSTLKTFTVKSRIKTPQTEDTFFVNTYWDTNYFYLAAYNATNLCVFNRQGIKGTGYNKAGFAPDEWYDVTFTADLVNNKQKLIKRRVSNGEEVVAESNNTFTDLTDQLLTIGIWSSAVYPMTVGAIDMKYFSVKFDGEEVFSGNKTGLDVVNDIEIPYTLGSTGIKIVDSTYLDRVKDAYDQHYLERYCTTDETTQTVYEYPLFRDSMHAYEFDEGMQASITKNGIHNAITLTEATKTSMYQNNTDTVALIEN